MVTARQASKLKACTALMTALEQLRLCATLTSLCAADNRDLSVAMSLIDVVLQGQLPSNEEGVRSLPRTV